MKRNPWRCGSVYSGRITQSKIRQNRLGVKVFKFSEIDDKNPWELEAVESSYFPGGSCWAKNSYIL